MRVLRLLLPTLALFTSARVAVAEPPEESTRTPIEVGLYSGGWFSNYFHDFYQTAPTAVRKLEGFCPVAGVRVAYLPHRMFGAEAEFQYTMAKLEEPSSDTPIYGFRAHGIGQYSVGPITPYAVLGLGLSRLSSPSAALGSDTDLIFHGGVGAKYHVAPAIVIRADARFLRGPASRADDSGANYAELMLGVSFVPQLRPRVARIEPEPDDRPEPDPGFFDPEPENVDLDGDGIRNEVDMCPEKAEDMDGFEDEDGCPDLDNDQDGIPDATDNCPNEREDPDGFEDTDGCDDPDNDRDGIPDVIDQCAIEPETINGKDDEDGCPDVGDSLVMLMPARIEIFESVRFKGNTAVLDKRSESVLGQVGATLRANREILQVLVGVHVQPRNGSDFELTKDRAAAVRQWLIDWGVEPERLEAKGFGSQVPLVPANEKGAKQINDRVEFTIRKTNIKKKPK